MNRDFIDFWVLHSSKNIKMFVKTTLRKLKTTKITPKTETTTTAYKCNAENIVDEI